MKFNIFFTIKGPIATLDVPNNTNPVECADLMSLLTELAGKLPGNKSLGLEVVGVRVEPAAEDLPR